MRYGAIAFRSLLAVIACMSLLLLSTCGKDSPTQPKAPEPTPPPPPTPVATRVDVSPTSATLSSVGQTVQLTARVFDQNNAPMNAAVVTWTSSATGVATVNGQGLVTAISNGSTTITARSGNASATATVTVMQSAGGIAIEPSSATLMSLGETVQLTASVLDGNGQPVADAIVTWTSSATGVATVSSQGLVTAVQNGSATITARTGSASTTATVKVMQSAGSIAVEPSSATLMSLGETVQLTATVLDGNGQPVADAVVTWTSSAVGVATVSSQGLVTAVSNGNATITARSGSASASIAVSVSVMDDSMDREALMALYNSTDGPNWVKSDNWLSEEPLNTWWGVSTNSEGRLDSLNLSQNGLNGSIPPELGSLSELNSLRLSSNYLVGSIPPELGKLARLQFLYLDQNALFGRIPSELGKLTRLQFLYLDQNALSDQIPPELGNLTRLYRLVLDYNQLTGPIPPELGLLVELSIMHLNNNQLTGPIPREFGDLTVLRQLRLYRNQLAGIIPPELGNLASLHALSLSTNKFSGPIPPELGKLVNLKYLDLKNNQLTGSIPPELGNLVKLETLDLYDNQLTGFIPKELGNLANLQGLFISENQLEGTIPQSFLELRLYTMGCRVTNGVCLPATDEFREWARQVEARGAQETAATPVDIPYCDVIDRRGLAAFYEATNGTQWASSDGWLDEDESLDQWYGVQTDSIGRVISLDLNSNGLSGSVPEALGMLANMKILKLGNNALSGQLPLSLAAVPLEEFDYAGTSLCLVDDADFQVWLDGISQHNGTWVLCDPLTEREILASLYWSTGGPQWANSSRWLTEAPLSSWYGVDTDDVGRVAGLQLSQNNLSGEIPTVLGQLEELRSLNLSGNELSSVIPPELGQLAELRHLDLDSNELSSVIPPELGQLAELRHLDLGRNELSSVIPPELGQLAALQRLDLGSNALTGAIPPELGSLGRLEELNLGNELGFGNNRLSGVIPAELGAVVALKHMLLEGNKLTGPIPPELGVLANLVRLNLGDNQFTGPIPAELGSLAALEHMLLEDNELTGPVPPELGSLSNLVDLNLSGNELTGPIPTELGDLDNLTELNLGDNQVTGSIPAELGDLANLTDLNLGDNQLTGPIPGELGLVGSLEHLDLRSNALSGPVPPEIGNLILLKSLILADNPDLVGRMPHGITVLENLKLLMAGGTGVCRPADARFDAWFRNIDDRRLVVCEGGASVYLTQTVQSWDDPVPLLAGEPALLRVFVTGPKEESVTMPDVRAAFFVNGAELHTVHIPTNSQVVPAEIDEGDLSISANAEIPDWVVAPGLEMVIEVDPDGALDPALGVKMRIPEAGRIPVDVRDLLPLQLTLIPLLFADELDESVVETVEAMAADPHDHELLRDIRTLLPIAGFEVTAREPVVTSTKNSYTRLSQLAAMRLMEEGSGYWMGIFWATPGLTPALSLAITGEPVSVSRPVAGTMAHELGHNLGLAHAPCGTPASTDPWFPYPGGLIGAYGYDFGQRTLVPLSTPDLMSYCGPPVWISDFFFNKALNHRLTNEDGAVMAANTEQTLLLWGGRDEDGVPYLDPAFVVDAVPSQPHEGGAYIIEGITADDEVLFSHSFDMPVIPDAEGEETSFVFTLPVQYGWAGNLESITLSGPEGTAVLDKSTNRPMAILQDPVTRQVRAFLSDLPAEGSDQSVAARATVVDPGLEMIFSRGIPDLR